MYIKRDLAPRALYLATKFPVIAILGPRQAGKTTLAKATFSTHAYYSLSDGDTLDRVKNDPRAFLEKEYGSGVIIDEFQQYPELLSYMQGIVDKWFRPGYFILTGSHNFLMTKIITQSLAGRIGLLTLLPLSSDELRSDPELSKQPLESLIYNGGYPAVYSRGYKADEYYSAYMNTYVEKDVWAFIGIGRMHDFKKFMRLCAGRIGQLLDYTSFANDCGITQPTAKAWLSILEASYIVLLVHPHHENFNKRSIKTPKLYFYDTGLASYLLRVPSAESAQEHYLYGGLFESFFFAELHKAFFNKGQLPNTYFWRDNHKKEVDCIFEYGTQLVPVETKSSKTFNSSFFDGLRFYCELAGLNQEDAIVVYGGDEEFATSNGKVMSWRNISTLVKE